MMQTPIESLSKEARRSPRRSKKYMMLSPGIVIEVDHALPLLHGGVAVQPEEGDDGPRVLF